jgi:dipeptidyl aminopeptidase/acylaminoacyl peptidase
MSAVQEQIELRPEVPEGAQVELVRVSPDGARVAFARADDEGAGVWIAPAGGGPAEQVIALDPWRAVDLAFSPDGLHVSYVLKHSERLEMRRFIGWARSEKGSAEVKRLEGATLAWTPSGKSLIAAVPTEKAVLRLDVAGSKAEKLAEIRDDNSPRIPPRIAVSPDGARIAFTARRLFDDVSEVWTITRGSPPVVELLTQVPGAEVDVLPFWSPGGVSLGLSMIHRTLEKSGIVVVRDLQGEGEIVHEHEGMEPVSTPAWAGDTIALMRADENGERLVLLNPRTLIEIGVTRPGSVAGEPHFLKDGRLAVDGGTAAHVLALATPP